MDFLQLNQMPTSLQAVVSSKELVSGQILFSQGEPTEAIFAVESGCIKLVHYTEEGQLINHYSVKTGESFAETALFNKAYDCTAIAEVFSHVLVLPKQPFLTALRQYPDLAEVFIMHLAQHLHKSKILLELRSIRSARKRVLHYLQLVVEPDGITINLSRPLKDIAEELGLTPEALSRALKQLQKEGFIERRKRKVKLRKDIVQT